MMTVEERYQRDPQFRHLVDALYIAIRGAKYTPTEVREAAMLAQIRYETYNPRPVRVFVPSNYGVPLHGDECLCVECRATL